jgi:heme-degrading monooxygenase HmoA
MFMHLVLFEIKPGEIRYYHKDNKMWADYARKAKGFIGYLTMKRADYKNQYVSVYQWENKADHSRFMKRYHDWLVGKSKAKVKVLGYYNLKVVVQIK